MAKSPTSDINIPQEYSKLRNNIIDGTITPEETKELYKAVKEAGGAFSNVGKISDQILNDLYDEAGSKNFHKFTIQLVEAEKEAMREKFPIDGVDEEKVKAGQDGRAQQFYRNDSLAKRAMIFEATKEGFGREVFEALKSGKPEEAIEKLGTLTIPDNLKDTLCSIQKFYNENDKGPEFYTNYSFHMVKTIIQDYNNQEFKDDRKKNASIAVATALAFNSAFDLKDPEVKAMATALIDKQLAGQQPTEEEHANFTGQAKTKLDAAIQKKIELEKAKANEAIPEQSDNKAGAPPKEPTFRGKALLAVNNLIDKVKDKVKNMELPGLNKKVQAEKTVKAAESAKKVDTTMPKQLAATKDTPDQSHQWSASKPTAITTDSRQKATAGDAPSQSGQWKKAKPAALSSQTIKVDPPLPTPVNPKTSSKGGPAL